MCCGEMVCTMCSLCCTFGGVAQDTASPRGAAGRLRLRCLDVCVAEMSAEGRTAAAHSAVTSNLPQSCRFRGFLHGGITSEGEGARALGVVTDTLARSVAPLHSLHFCARRVPQDSL